MDNIYFYFEDLKFISDSLAFVDMGLSLRSITTTYRGPDRLNFNIESDVFAVGILPVNADLVQGGPSAHEFVGSCNEKMACLIGYYVSATGDREYISIHPLETAFRILESNGIYGSTTPTPKLFHNTKAILKFNEKTEVFLKLSL